MPSPSHAQEPRADVLPCAPASAATGAALRWELRRNCAFSPRQLMLAYAALCALTFVPAAVGTVMLASPLIALFALLELLLVAVAMLVYARHARDGDTITLDGAAVVVERLCGERMQRQVFAAVWLRVAEPGEQEPLVRLCARGIELCIGQHARPAQRRAVARELRLALSRRPPASGRP